MFGAQIQYAKPEYASPLLNKEDSLFVHQVTGAFLYYIRAVDPTVIVALSAIASSELAPTEEIMKKVKYFLEYAASHLDTILPYNKSDTKLSVHINASYLREPKARRRAGGHFFTIKSIMTRLTMDPS